MLSFQIGCRLSHSSDIQRMIGKIGIQTFYRHGKFCSVNSVLIGFTALAVSGMPVCGNLLRFLHTDILRQLLVQRVGNLPGRHTAPGVKHSHISHGMYTGVRAASANHLNGFFQKLTQMPVQLFLNRNSVILLLPSMIIRSVIRNRHTDTFLHSRDSFLFHVCMNIHIVSV